MQVLVGGTCCAPGCLVDENTQASAVPCLLSHAHAHAGVRSADAHAVGDRPVELYKLG